MALGEWVAIQRFNVSKRSNVQRSDTRLSRDLISGPVAAAARHVPPSPLIRCTMLRSGRNKRSKTSHHFDRIPLEDDFEVIHARSSQLSYRNAPIGLVAIPIEGCNNMECREFLGAGMMTKNLLWTRRTSSTTRRSWLTSLTAGQRRRALCAQNESVSSGAEFRCVLRDFCCRA